MFLPETVLHDLQYGIRMISRNKGATIVTVLALAIGVGVNTAVFTAYKAMVARSLDARAPAEMVSLALLRDSGAAEFSFSYPDYEEYRDAARSFSGLVAFRPARVTLSNAGGMLSQRWPQTGNRAITKSSSAGSKRKKIAMRATGSAWICEASGSNIPSPRPKAQCCSQFTSGGHVRSAVGSCFLV
jgi:hypothetical protein